MTCGSPTSSGASPANAAVSAARRCGRSLSRRAWAPADAVVRALRRSDHFAGRAQAPDAARCRHVHHGAAEGRCTLPTHGKPRWRRCCWSPSATAPMRLLSESGSRQTSRSEIHRRADALLRYIVMPPPPRTGGPPVTNIRNTSSPHWRGLAQAGEPLPCAVNGIAEVIAKAAQSGFDISSFPIRSAKRKVASVAHLQPA